MSNARDRNDALARAVLPPLPGKTSFRHRAVQLHKSLSSPNSNASLPFRLAHPPRQPDSPRRPPETRTWVKDKQAP